MILSEIFIKMLENSFSWIQVTLIFADSHVRWKFFPPLMLKRGNAAGIVFENQFYIFGGYDEVSLRSTEFITADGIVDDIREADIRWEFGPSMPIELHGHAITKFNQVSSIISGGGTGTFGDPNKKTWFYNHETYQFSEGPPLLQLRKFHASATLVDKHGIYIRTIRP